MNKDCVIIIDPRGSIDLDDNYTINRHLKYAEHLKNKSQLTLVIISSNKESQRYEGKNLIYLSIKRNNIISPLFIRNTVRLIQANKFIPKVFIAGDPWESFEAAKCVSRNMNSSRNTPIQIQLHADVFNSQWYGSRLINKIRFIWCKRNLSKADSIRLVSQAQLENFPREPKIAEKILVSPVPLNLVKNPPIYINNRPNSIGFVGRIENDRGLDDLLIICNKLSSLIGEIEIVVAGKGKKTKYLLHELSKIVPRSRIIYLRHLEPENMSIAWSKIGVLISTAKSESYGRVMREAACYGIPVMSVLNNGAMMLSKEMPKDWIEFIDPNESPISIATKFNKTRKQVTSSIFLQKIRIKENIDMETLITSWIELSKK